MKERIYAFGRRVLKSDLITGSTFIFLGTMIGNILAFIFNIFLVRHLSYASYAEVTSIISLITLASIPAQAFLPTIIQFSGRYFAKNQLNEASELFWQSSMKMGLVAGIIFFAFIVFSGSIASFLHIKNIFEIIIAGAIIAAIYLGITNTSFLQSLLKFKFLSFTTILGGILKLGVGVGVITLGFGALGVLWGYFFSFLIPFVITYIPLYFLLNHKRGESTLHFGEIINYGLPAAIAIFSLSSFTSTDILLVKHFFPSSSAAMYGGLSLVGRIIFYFSAPISTVMFPLVIKRIHQGQTSQNLLLASFLLVLLPSFALSIFYFLFPHIVITIFLGKAYLAISPYLGWFGFYLCIFSLLNVLVNFFLSMQRMEISWVIAFGAVFQVIGIFMFHNSINIIILLSSVLCLVLFVLLLLYYVKLYAYK